MLIGDQDHCWNRRFSIKPIAKLAGIIVGLLLILGWGYTYLWPAFGTCIWTIEHRSTATYQKLAVKVPWMWMQEETPAGQREIRLVRARWFEPVSTESIVISQNIPPSSPQTIMQRFEILSSKLGQSDFKGVQLRLDPEFASQYACVYPRLNLLTEWRASCDSTDGLWSVNLNGPKPDMADLLTVLRNLTSAQKSAISSP